MLFSNCLVSLFLPLLKMEYRQKLSKFIDDLSDLLTEQSSLTNGHLVDFITANMFETLLPPNVQAELLAMDNSEISQLPAGRIDSGQHPYCGAFLSRCQQFSPVNLIKMFPVELTIEDQPATDRFHIGVQKCYEVCRMASLIAQLCDHNSLTQVVDIGSGKGYLSSYLASNYRLKVVGFDSCQVRTNSAVKRQNLLHKRLGTNSNGLYTPVKAEITVETDLSSLSGLDANQKFLLCGLHTCGDLASSSIQLFTANSNSKAICIVGCCYNRIQEEFNSEAHQSGSFGFPMSTVLKAKRFQLGRNARMLAAQPVQRIAETNRTPNRSLYWRALLQQIMLDYNVLSGGNVGRKVASNCQTFHQYVKLAFGSLNIPLSLTDEQIDQYLSKFASFQQSLNAFISFRAALAPLVECLVMADRLLYLLNDETVETAYILPVFDPVKSPRSHALVAVKY